MNSSAKARIAGSLVAAVTGIMLAVGVAGPATATGQYQFTCTTPGQADWAMPKGTPDRMCSGGVIIARINGAYAYQISINDAGARYLPRKLTKNQIKCAIGFVADGVMAIATDGGWLVYVGAVGNLAWCTV